MRFRQGVLATLLTLFALFVVHDLMLAERDTCASVERHVSTHHHHASDALSSIHDRMHHILDAVRFVEKQPIVSLIQKESFEYHGNVTTLVVATLERPPTFA